VETTYRWRFDASGDYRSSRSPTTRVTIAQPPQETVTGIDVVIEDGNDDQIYDGQTATFRGTLTVDGAPKYNRTLVLEASTDGGATWTQVVSQATNIHGQVIVTRSPRTTARYRWRFPGAGSFLLPSTSPERTLTVTPRTATALTASAVATTIDSGERAQLKVLLTAAGQPLVGAAVTLQRSVPGTGEWGDVLTATTGSDGRAALSVAQEENTAYRWTYAGTVSRLPATSSGVVVQSRFVVQVTSVVPPTSAPGRLRVLGRVTPYTGAPVRLMRPGGLSGAFEVARATLRTDGTFTIFATLENAGTYSFFVEVGPDLQNAKGRTPSFTVVVPGS
jgi:hypothetical protein